MSSNFDPSLFLDATLSEPSTRRPPIPAGLDLVGIIADVKMRPWQGRKDPTQSGLAADVTVEFDLSAYPDVQKVVNVPKVTISDSLMLNLTDAGLIDNSPGKNGKLRRYREALNMNKPDDSFSFRQMIGRQIKARISHREHEGDLYDQIETVARAV